MKKVYCVKIEHLLGPGKGRVGFHSVFADRNTAERQAEIRNKHGGREFRYWVEERTDGVFAQNWWNRNLVRFEDSFGFLAIL